MKNVLVLSLCCFLSSNAWAIKKCQDSEGNWHYGDVAVRDCENSKVTTLNRRGVIKDEKAAPKSAEQREADEKAMAEAQALEDEAKAAELERSRILSIYETEADIDRQRDNQLHSVQSNIDVHDSYLKSMQTRIERQQAKLKETTAKKKKQRIAADIETSKANLAAYSKSLEKLKRQKQSIVTKFEQEKQLYRELKGERDS